jgi:hypothetical protein
MMPRVDLEEGADKASEYVTAVQDFVVAYALAKTGSGTVPTSLSFTPSSVSINPATSQLIARAIYVDFMPQAVVDKISEILTGEGNNDSIPSLVPFYEVHMTKLADWSVNPDLSKALVTSEAVETDTEGLTDLEPYSRGFVQPAASPTAGNALIIASLTSHNTGVTGTLAVNSGEGSHPRTDVNVGNGQNATTYYYSAIAPPSETSPAISQHKDGTMTVAVAGNTSTITISGSIKKAKGSSTIAPSLIATPTVSGVPCTPKGANGQDLEAFECVVTPDASGSWAGTIHFSSSANYVFCLGDGQDAKGNSPAVQCQPTLTNGDWTPLTPLTVNEKLTIFVSTPVP